MPIAYIFQCNNATEPDCFNLNLFGAGHGWPLQVEAGSPCFLFNFEKKVIYGIFEAISHGERDIDPAAWGGRYRNQVRVQRISQSLITVPRADIGVVINDPRRHQVCQIVTDKHADALLRYFALFDL